MKEDKWIVKFLTFLLNIPHKMKIEQFKMIIELLVFSMKINHFKQVFLNKVFYNAAQDKFNPLTIMGSNKIPSKRFKFIRRPILIKIKYKQPFLMLELLSLYNTVVSVKIKEIQFNCNKSLKLVLNSTSLEPNKI